MQKPRRSTVNNQHDLLSGPFICFDAFENDVLRVGMKAGDVLQEIGSLRVVVRLPAEVKVRAVTAEIGFCL
jgi:hypothetical protein